ncbi:MAG: beta-eliminating lyase-related protein [Coriobacteriales bacterium]|nr:beta-eliminating lyase-related protein [Coriobacteriales bacterium]
MTKKLSFASDYMEGAQPAILEALARTNLDPMPGYGTDPVSDAARESIRAACDCPQALVQFLVGGTQVNATMIDVLLAPWQGVLAADTGHIATHEAGAIEAGGHKVLTLPARDGKLSAETVDEYCTTMEFDENRDHMVMPGLVYISQPTEYGTLYSRSELEAMRAVCDAHGLRLYADGARLAYALGCASNDASLADLARLCDAFYIGGTKCGALFGEAVVVPDPKITPHLFTMVKQHGALLAKGWLLGLQFSCLFEDDLYTRGGKAAVELADRLRDGLVARGWELASQAPTNQVFVRLSQADYERLSETVEMSFWERTATGEVVVRLATSWATTNEQVEALLVAFTQ